MSLEKQKHKTLIVALSALLVFGLTSCAAVSTLFGPPEAPPIPKWAYSRKYIKPVGMLPDAVPWAQAYWTKNHHLFVIGRPMVPGKWSRYYSHARYGEAPGDRESFKEYFPLWNPQTGKSLPV